MISSIIKTSIIYGGFSIAIFHYRRASSCIPNFAGRFFPRSTERAFAAVLASGTVATWRAAGDGLLERNGELSGEPNRDERQKNAHKS